MATSFTQKIRTLYSMLVPSTQARRVAPWLALRGDQTLRMNYPLTEKSVVFDIGAFEGQWASDIYGRYRCTIHCFEPLPQFANDIRARFIQNSDIKVHAYGLAGSTRNESIISAGDRTSIHITGEHAETIALRDIAEVMKELKITKIDLLKINIEGGEYEVLNRLIDEELITKVTNIQVQFHDFYPNAEQEMASLQGRLSATHKLTYQYPFVWENWELLAKA